MRFRIELLQASLVACVLTAPAALGDDASASTNSPTSATVSTNTPEKVGYAVGVSVGMNITNNLKHFNFDASNDEIMNGIRDVLTGHELKMSPAEAREILVSYQQEKQREAMEKLKETAAKNEKEGEAFLAANKNKDGIKTKEVTLPDGKTAEFQYKVITQGTGETPKSNDVVKVKYRGTLINGTEFDNSEKHGGTATFQVNGVIRGWTEALEMMPVGSKWQLFIPASLAYGDMARPGIEPGSTLIFEVELLDIEAQKPVAARPSQPLTSDIVRVPSAEERKEGRQPEIITPAEAERIAREEAAKQQQKKQ